MRLKMRENWKRVQDILTHEGMSTAESLREILQLGLDYIEEYRDCTPAQGFVTRVAMAAVYTSLKARCEQFTAK